MKLTESRIKQIILEEMQSLQEQEEVQKEKEDDSAKNMAEFNEFLSRNITSNDNVLSVKTAFAIKATKRLGNVPID